MNILHLKYAVEVQRARSITKAAENLFMGQPNLSRGIKELEESLGITIFKRTAKETIPTREGEEFLEEAKHILAQIDELQSRYKKSQQDKETFSISVPRASYISEAFTNVVSSFKTDLKMEFDYKETNSMRTINNVLERNYNLGIIRYPVTYENFFLNMMREKDLQHELVSELEFSLVMSEDHPLAHQETITPDDLKGCIEVLHGDPHVPSLSLTQIKKSELSEEVDKRIFVYERASQFELLSRVPNAYMWASPTPPEFLARHNLVHRRCEGFVRRNKDLLIYKKNYRLSHIDQKFLDELYRSLERSIQALQ